MSQKCRVPSEPLELVLYTMGCLIQLSTSLILDIFREGSADGGKTVVGFLRGDTGHNVMRRGY
jgi:hypothetical protein